MSTHHHHEPSESEIQKEAYLIWRASGCEEGRALDHWLAAKELLRHRHAKPTPSRSGRKASVPVDLHFPPSSGLNRPDDADPKGKASA